jgi:hypothetical protein
LFTTKFEQMENVSKEDMWKMMQQTLQMINVMMQNPAFNPQLQQIPSQQTVENSTVAEEETNEKELENANFEVFIDHTYINMICGI